MATVLYFRQARAALIYDASGGASTSVASWTSYGTGREVAAGDSTQYGGDAFQDRLGTDIGTGTGLGTTTASITGPTAGRLYASETAATTFFSPPLAADVTIAGTVTFNLCGSESSMNANAVFGVAIYRLDEDGGNKTLILKAFSATELGTTLARMTFTGTPTSTLVKKGQRLLAYVLFDDAPATTMASGFTLLFQMDGSNANTADSNMSFTETITFLSTAPTGTQYFLRDTASDLGGNGLAASTTQGAATATAVHTTIAGPLTFPGDQWTATAGGSDVEWFTPPLDAFTLGGACHLFIGAGTALGANSAGNFDAPVWEVAVVDANGANPVVWARTVHITAGGAPPTLLDGYLNGPDLAVGQGQRLRIRLYQDDFPASTTNSNAVAGNNRTLRYGGTSTYATSFQFTQTITEAAPAAFIAKKPLTAMQAINRASSW